MSEIDLAFDPRNFSVIIESIGGNIPDEGAIYEKVAYPRNIKTVQKKIEKSLEDLGLSVEFSGNFYGK